VKVEAKLAVLPADAEIHGQDIGIVPVVESQPADIAFLHDFQQLFFFRYFAVFLSHGSFPPFGGM